LPVARRFGRIRAGSFLPVTGSLAHDSADVFPHAAQHRKTSRLGRPVCSPDNQRKCGQGRSGQPEQARKK